MVERQAACSCGQLTVVAVGDPARISVCHCLACQRRTGSVFGAQARFPTENVAVHGESSTWSRTGESGGTVTFHFCPVCAATVFYQLDFAPDMTAVPLGAFADPSFPPPTVSVYDECAHPWVTLPDALIRE